ncbi:MAG: hypothetical protein ABGX69_04375 [Methylococcales bacterium]
MKRALAPETSVPLVNKRYREIILVASGALNLSIRYTTQQSADIA